MLLAGDAREAAEAPLVLEDIIPAIIVVGVKRREWVGRRGSRKV